MDEAAAETLRTDQGARSRKGAAAVLGAVGIGAIVLFAGAWVVRIEAADALLRSAMAERGVRGAWTVTRLDPFGARLESVRVGAPDKPDFQARAIDLAFAWGFGPRLSGVAVDGGRLQARWTQAGLDLGDVGRLVQPGPSAARAPMPRLAVDVRGMSIALETPAGRILAGLNSSGRLTQDFRADATILSPTGSGPTGAFADLRGALVVRTEANTLNARLDGAAGRFDGPWGKLAGVALQGAGTIDAALTKTDLDLKVRADRWSFADITISGWTSTVSGAAAGAFPARGPHTGPDSWRADVRNEVDRITVPAASLAGIAADLSIAGAHSRGEGTWTIGSARTEATGFALPVETKGTVRLRDGSWSGDGSLRVRGGKAQNPNALLRALNAASATPLGPLFASARPAMARAVQAFDVDAPLAFAFADGAGAIRGAAAVEARSASGARLTLAPPADAPPWQITFPGGRLGAAGEVALQGGELPTLRVRRFALDLSAASTDMAGHLEAPRWRAANAAFQADDLDFVWRGGQAGGRLTLAGDVVLSGPLAGARLIDLRAPLDLDVETAGKAWRLKPRSRCLSMRAGAIDAIGMRFSDAPLALCATSGGAFAEAAPDGALSGGLDIGGATLRGRTDGPRSSAIRLTVSQAGLRLSGTSASPVLAATLSGIAFTQAAGPGRTLRADAARLDLEAAAARDWGVRGAFSGARVADESLIFTVSEGRGALRIDQENGGAVVRITDAAAVATDDASPKPILEPLRIVDGEATIADGKVTGAALIRVKGNDAPLGRVDIEHDIASGAGEARFAASDLTFSDRLQPYDITQAALGVVDNVAGPIDMNARARWTADAAHIDGALSLKAIAAATKGLGPLTGISGKIVFDDLAALTTPPHQEIRVAEINPGVRVRDGLIRFQLQPNAVVALESAQFPFSNGRLSVTPTFVKIGADETRYTIEVSDLDVAQFLRDLDLKDLTATGRVQGIFPVVVTPTGARIENGLLTAAPGGGMIAYTGDASKGASGGPSQVAFDALRNFRYDDLALELNGDLDGEIVTGIRFKGVNNMPVSAATLVPGMKTIGATGLPFRFNVTVRAPFRKLAEGAKRLATPLSQLDATQGIDPGKVP